MSTAIYVSYYAKDPKTGEPYKFDVDYYLNTHMQLVQKHWGPHGMKSWSVIEFEENDPSGLHVQCIMRWESREHFDKCYALGIPEVHEDLKHYTNGMPVRYIGKVLLNG